MNWPTSFFLLAVGGTAGNDHIIFRPGELAGDIVVQLNGVWPVTSRLTARVALCDYLAAGGLPRRVCDDFCESSPGSSSYYMPHAEYTIYSHWRM